MMEDFLVHQAPHTTHDNSMDIFISHSSQDQIITKLIADLIRKALNVPEKKIRCTSVNGYKLPIGASTDNQLREEMLSAKVFIGIISQYSVQSTYVLLEFGARWGANLPLLPLIIDNKGYELLKGPLTGINALSCFNELDLFQFVGDLSALLKIEAEKPDVYKESLNHLLAAITESNKDMFEKVEIEAYFSGGDAAWRRYLERNVDGDIATANDAPAGTYTVVIQFVVDKEGMIADVKQLTNHGYGMEQEAMKVIKRGPRWEPAIQNGRRVKAYRKQPITFQVS